MSKINPGFRDGCGIGVGHIFKNDGRFTCRYCGEDNGRHSHNCPTQNKHTEIGKKVARAEWEGTDGGYDRF